MVYYLIISVLFVRMVCTWYIIWLFLSYLSVWYALGILFNCSCLICPYGIHLVYYLIVLVLFVRMVCAWYIIWLFLSYLSIWYALGILFNCSCLISPYGMRLVYYFNCHMFILVVATVYCYILSEDTLKPLTISRELNNLRKQTRNTSNF